MANFLKSNGPWSQLVNYRNIILNGLQADRPTFLTSELSVTPFFVPHRDEYSETVGYKIQHGETSLLYIPDINKWELWEKSIEEEILKVDYALLDGTFYDSSELPGVICQKSPIHLSKKVSNALANLAQPRSKRSYLPTLTIQIRLS